MTMFDNAYLVEEHATRLRRAADDRRLARQATAAQRSHRWSRIATWAEERARRAAEQIDS
jgi:hypothetical protein